MKMHTYAKSVKMQGKMDGNVNSGVLERKITPEKVEIGQGVSARLFLCKKMQLFKTIRLTIHRNRKGYAERAHQEHVTRKRVQYTLKYNIIENAIKQQQTERYREKGRNQEKCLNALKTEQLIIVQY